MRILVLQFYLLVFCGAAEFFTEKSVDLGQNVTLKCEVSVHDVYWFLMKVSEPPVFILRSYSRISLAADYSNTTFNKRFSLQYNSSLFIHNISTNELGVYYCIHTQKGSPPNISRGIRLYIHSHSAENQTCNTECLQNQTGGVSTGSEVQTSLIISVIMNCVLVITVFTVQRCRRSPKTQTQPPGSSQQQQDNGNPVYSEVQFPVTTKPTRTSDQNCTYALVKQRTHDPGMTPV
ncbi:uncharacterized protein LOC132838820 isoform X2 [Tachysurus vachellii]|uniref:uncharacterized protein LOC132838820 isoform X2 n=1 Tax=Tachysurus vachellii TaxID=175792 RepID=UPI00296ADF0D|nr:uncharacterized protein LOC132838820 isoform X2 [Tachysurus vachellii]